MPFNQLQRRDSWPPTILRIGSSSTSGNNDIAMIDENPFAYFLTSPEDIGEDLDEFSAGIESDDVKPIIRSVSPSDLQRDRLNLESPPSSPDGSATQLSTAVPMTLREFSASQARSPSHPSASDSVRRWMEQTAPSKRIVKETPRRGRGKVRLAPGGLGKMRGTRSLSARRPRSWKEPSPDVWSIPEGHESGSSQEKENETEQREVTRVESPRSPGKKTVHWALP